jgi:hypothetical protein
MITFQGSQNPLAYSETKERRNRQLFLCLALIGSLTGCQLATQKTNALASLETAEGPQIVIAETSALLPQYALVDVFLNGEYVGNTSDVPVITIPDTQANNHIVAQGLFAASYAELGEHKFDSADNSHHYILIEPSLTDNIIVRKVSRAPWTMLSK